MNRGIKTRRDKENTNYKMVGLNPITLIITVNINGLNSPIKKYRLIE